MGRVWRRIASSSKLTLLHGLHLHGRVERGSIHWKLSLLLVLFLRRIFILLLKHVVFSLSLLVLVARIEGGRLTVDQVLVVILGHMMANRLHLKMSGRVSLRVLRGASRYLCRLSIYKLNLDTTEHGRPLCAILLVLKHNTFLKQCMLLLVLAERVLLRRATRALLIHQACLTPSVRRIKLGALQGLLSVSSSCALIVNFLPAFLAESLFTLWAESMTVFFKALLTDLHSLMILGGSYVLRLGGRSRRMSVLISICPSPDILVFLLHTIWRTTGEFIGWIWLSLCIRFLRRFWFIFAII